MSLPLDQRDGFIWYDGKLVPWTDCKIHVLTHGLHYASCVFEGERAYGGVIFKSSEHSERLKRSAQLLDFELPYSVADLDAAKRLVLERNGQTDAYVRPLAWRGSEATRRVGTAECDPRRHRDLGMAELLRSRRAAEGHPSRLRRLPPSRSETMPALAKAAGLYMICTISKHKAERKGYADAMMLDWQGRVAECTGANIFFVRDGKIHTPIADCFLDGITRRTVDRTRQTARHRGGRAAHHAGGAQRLLGMLHHRHRGGGHARVRDRAVEVHAGRDHPAADG